MSFHSIKTNLVHRFMSSPNRTEILLYLFFIGMCALGAYIGSGHHPH